MEGGNMVSILEGTIITQTPTFTNYPLDRATDEDVKRVGGPEAG